MKQREKTVAKLNERSIKAKLHTIRGWKRSGDTIVRVVRAKDFVRAMGFVQSVALLAEKADHHPDIDIRWNTVTLVLTTHSEGGLTEKDFALAALINALEKSKI